MVGFVTAPLAFVVILVLFDDVGVRVDVVGVGAFGGCLVELDVFALWFC